VHKWLLELICGSVPGTVFGAHLEHAGSQGLRFYPVSKSVQPATDIPWWNSRRSLGGQNWPQPQFAQASFQRYFGNHLACKNFLANSGAQTEHSVNQSRAATSAEYHECPNYTCQASKDRVTTAQNSRRANSDVPPKPTSGRT
jgi:hypothetical protein